jgi:hypothetical protein
MASFRKMAPISTEKTMLTSLIAVTLPTGAWSKDQIKMAKEVG